MEIEFVDGRFIEVDGQSICTGDSSLPLTVMLSLASRMEKVQMDSQFVDGHLICTADVDGHLIRVGDFFSADGRVVARVPHGEGILALSD